MFCINCGVELPEDSNFCLKCGKPQHSASGASTPLSIQGRWQYQEFSVQLDGREYQGTGWPIDGSIAFKDAISPITHAVIELVNRLGPAGWEPIEPIEVDRLWRNQRIIGNSRSTNRWSYKIYWKPTEVRINFRRWVT
jgi:hypothetical protein